MRAHRPDAVDQHEQEPEQEHPKGALLFMLIYLVVLAGLWLNAYLRLWRD